MPSLLDSTSILETREAEIVELRRRLTERGATDHHRGIHEIALPDKLYRLLVGIIAELADGKAVSLTARQQMTSQEAANILGVSRQFLVRLLDEGKIPFHRTGTHRRVYLQDLVSYRADRDHRRHAAIEKMARDAVKDGVYDEF